MSGPQQLIDSIYIGDRACKAITIDGWNATLRIQVDCISRIRSASGKWDFYSAEDIPDGFIVFKGVRRMEWQNDGYVPNDLINSLDLVGNDGDAFVLKVSIDSVDSDANHHETILRITCESIHLEDPNKPGVVIV